VDDSWVIHGLFVGHPGHKPAGDGLYHRRMMILGMVYDMGLSALLIKGSPYISFRMVNLYHH
jgi:hypothetical protein